MKRTLLALAALGCLAAPALADTCSAATEAAARAALDAAQASGRRTATLRVSCGGERQTLIFHRSQGPSGASVSVREVKPRGDNTGLAGEKRSSSEGTQARIIRLGD